MARLDRLMTAKGVAQLAAVIGRQFSFALLRAVSHLEEETLQQELQRLVHAQLIDQRGSPAQVTYIFKHALVTDIAYQSLLKSTRQEYHQRIAEVLEAHFRRPRRNIRSCWRIIIARRRLAKRLPTGSRRHDAWCSVQHRSDPPSPQGLALLSGLPETPQRMRQELALRAMRPRLDECQGLRGVDVEARLQAANCASNCKLHRA
jgi:hypothetical protein